MNVHVNFLKCSFGGNLLLFLKFVQMKACMHTLLKDNGHMQTSNGHGMKTNLNCWPL
jgi:hypothetical protein